MEQLINYLNNSGYFIMTLTLKSSPLIPLTLKIDFAAYSEEYLYVHTDVFTYEITLIKECYEDDFGWVVKCEDGTEYYFERIGD